jgi:hypothetical protein
LLSPQKGIKIASGLFMNEQDFCVAVNNKARETGLNPMLLLSGIEGWYTFRNIPLNSINYDYLDSLILTIFALRVGDKFHSIAEENMYSCNARISRAAIEELMEMTPDEIERSSNRYLQSFASIINGKSAIRKYHEKALEVAALEIRKAQLQFSTASISTIVINICATDDALHLGFLFSQTA